MDRKAYQRTLPRKRMSAGVLFFNKKGQLLVVNPTYKETWEIPGGSVEANESPRQAAEREVGEELGLALPPLALLGVDYTGETDTRTESIQFIFDGGVLSAEIIDQIVLPADELSEYRFLKPKKAMDLLNKKLRRRVGHCLKARERGDTVYMEAQTPVWEQEDT